MTSIWNNIDAPVNRCNTNLAPKGYVDWGVDRTATKLSTTNIHKSASTKDLTKDAFRIHRRLSKELMATGSKLIVSSNSSQENDLGQGGLRRVVSLAEINGSQCPDLNKKFRDLKATIKDLQIHTNLGVQELLAKHGNDALNSDFNDESTELELSEVSIKSSAIGGDAGQYGQSKLPKASGEPRNACKVGEFKKAVRRLSNHSAAVPEQEQEQEIKSRMPRVRSMSKLSDFRRHSNLSAQSKDPRGRRRSSITSFLESSLRLEDEL